MAGRPRPDGFVLAGGRSRRMGVDKATLAWRGGPMALVVADRLAEACGRVALVRRAPDGLPWPLPVVYDLPGGGVAATAGLDEPARHPLSGVAAALRAAQTELVVVAPCDVPDLTGDAVRALLAVGGPAVAHDGVRRHPLIAVYPRAWADRAERGAAAGIPARDFSAGCVEVPLPAAWLVNRNSPEDLPSGVVDPAAPVRYARRPAEE